MNVDAFRIHHNDNLCIPHPSSSKTFHRDIKRIVTAMREMGFDIANDDYEARAQIRIRHKFLQLVRNRSNLVVPSRRLEVASDPDDNRFLE